MHRERFFYQLTLCTLFMLVLLSGCGKATTISPTTTPGSATGSRSETATPATANQDSMITFSLAGGKSGSYTLHATTPISMLRHGHREFTIDIVDEQRSIFIVFYGYQGPGKYTLNKTTNGGDVHFSLGNAAPAWDLSLQPGASCALTISRDTPTALAGVDRMQGTLACPRLLSSNPAYPQPPISLQHGYFDLAMLIVS